MDCRKLVLWEISAGLFTFVIGTLLHFVYGWSGQNAVVASFAPVNESTFEHLKLLFFPLLIFSIAEYFVFGTDKKNFIPAKAISLFAGIFTITAAFYTYTGIIGRNYFAIDILTFIIGIAVAQYISIRLMKCSKRLCSRTANILGIAAIVLMTVAFVVFTYYPPNINLFVDPVTGGYGIQ